MDIKRILVLTSTYPRWQSDEGPVFVAELCKHLARSGYEVEVVAPHSPGARTEEIMDGVSVYRYRYFITSLQKLAYSGGILANLKKQPLIYFLIPFFLLFQLIAVRKRLQAGKYDLIHAHWVIPQGLVGALAVRLFSHISIPILCTSHGADLYSLRNILFKQLKTWTINKSAFLTVVSRTMMDDYLEYGIDEAKLAVISMGVDLKNTFVPASGIKRLKHRLIFVGRLVEKKGVSVLIEAMRLVVAKIPNVELLIIGDGPLKQSLQNMVTEYQLSDNIFFKGGMNNHMLPEYYSSATVAVVPSIVDSRGDQEGLGLVIIEAMGCGCAVVASALGPITSVVTDGLNGLLFRPGDARELAEKLLFLLSEPARSEELALQGRESVIHRFDWDVIGQQYSELIHRICFPLNRTR